MKKNIALLFSICTLFSTASFAQEQTAAPSATVNSAQSQALFGITLGAPITLPRCDPYKPAVGTTVACYTPSGNTSLFYGKTVQNIKIYFPKGTTPEGFVTQWLNAQTYKNCVVFMQVSTTGLAQQDQIYKALESYLGQASDYKKVSADGPENNENQYTKNSIVAIWDTSVTEIMFYGQYKTTGKGLLKAGMKINTFEKFANSTSTLH